MGVHRTGGRAARRGRSAGLTRPLATAAEPTVCRVRPDVPAVARAFDYVVPPVMRPAVGVGTIVRVPLHGRRVRGWVVADGVEPEAPRDRLVPLHAVVSAGPPPEIVALAEWAGWRWAGPVGTFLRAGSPVNVVDPLAEPAVRSRPGRVAPAPPEAPAWPDVAVRTLVWPPGADRRRLVCSALEPEGSTLVLVPEPARAGALVRAIAAEGWDVVHHHSDLSDRERTEAWVAARAGGRVVVGGRAATWLPMPDLRGVLVLDEGDEALQEEWAPTWHARDVAGERARRAGARMTLVSPAPTPSAWIAAGARLVPSPRALRAGWPALETVDIGREPPGIGLATSALGPAIHRALDDGGRALCVVNRRGRAALLACRSCGTLARCEVCGAAVAQPADVLACPRCGTTRPLVCLACGAARVRAVRVGVRGAREVVAALVPRAAVGEVDASSTTVGDEPVLVGTEAVLHRVGRGGDRPVRLVAFLVFDEELLAPRYRAHEQALWLLARAARLLGPRRGGGRLLVQTRLVDHPVLQVAATGDPRPFLDGEIAIRRTLAYPPFGGLAEVSGAPRAVAAAAAELRAGGLTVLGGVDGPALVRAPSPDRLADALARVTPARALGRLRVSVDPPRV